MLSFINKNKFFWIFNIIIKLELFLFLLYNFTIYFLSKKKAAAKFAGHLASLVQQA